MSRALDILGAGAFGTALAICFARAGHAVTLWARDGADEMSSTRENTRRLPGHRLPDGLRVTGEMGDLAADTLLLAVPTQVLDRVLDQHRPKARDLVSTAKGLHFASGLFPTELIARHCPAARPAQLTGPSFAEDLALGRPTALTLACAPEDAAHLLDMLHTPALRPYHSPDLRGAEIGGALKNVYAIACGAAMGAGLGLSARAAVMTRGFAEMTRFATALGARPETLAGLSGLGDLALTCGSEMSRNYRFGLALGRGAQFAEASTVEGAVTAQAVTARASAMDVDMPIAAEVARLIEGDRCVTDAIQALLDRRLTSEQG